MLVSVRNRSEAALVTAHPLTSIVDVKEPAAGSLGFAGAAVVNNIIGEVNGRKPISVACGELIGLNRGKPPSFADIRWDLVAWAKLGLTGLPTALEIQQQLPRFRQAIPPSVDLVLVIYADQLHPAAAIERVQASTELGMTMVLIDTFDKTMGDLFAHYSPGDCRLLIQAIDQMGLQYVLAGSISDANLDMVALADPKMIGVRGAVCESDRASAVDSPTLDAFLNLASERLRLQPLVRGGKSS